MSNDGAALAGKTKWRALGFDMAEPYAMVQRGPNDQDSSRLRRLLRPCTGGWCKWDRIGLKILSRYDVGYRIERSGNHFFQLITLSACFRTFKNLQKLGAAIGIEQRT